MPALCLLQKEGLMQSKQLLMFLLNSFKSTWALVRLNAFDLLNHFSASHSLLSDPDFVNNVIYKTAMVFCNNPKAMVSEGSGLLLKLLFNKCLPHLDFIKVTDDRDMQLQFCRHVLQIVKDRLSVFQ